VPGSSVTQDVQGLAELEAKLLAMPEKYARQALLNAAKKAATVLVEAARAIESPHSRTGKLASAIAQTVSTKGLGEAGAEVLAIVGIDTKKSRIGHLLERGTKAHTVKVKRAKVLANAQQVFGRVVRHPGARAYPFMQPAWDENQEYVLEIFQDELAAQIAAESTRP
jgi:HK97 gp10 family phage protein